MSHTKVAHFGVCYSVAFQPLDGYVHCLLILAIVTNNSMNVGIFESLFLILLEVHLRMKLPTYMVGNV